MIGRVTLVVAVLVLIALALTGPFHNVSVGETVLSPEETATPIGDASNETAVLLQAELDSVRRTDKRLLQTVYWSLGTLAAVAAGLIFFSWFTNVRLSDNDRTQLRQEIKTTIEQQTAISEDKIAKTLKEMKELLSEQVKNQTRQLEEEHRSQFEHLREGILLNMAQTIRTDVFG